MKIHFTPHHVQMTAAINEYVENKISSLEKINEHILGAHVTVLYEETRSKKYTVKVHVALPGPDIWAQAAADDLYSAVDEVVAKLTRQLRKRKTKIKERQKHLSQLAKEGEKRGFKRR